MAVTSTSNALTSAEQMQANYEKYKDRFTDANEELISSDTFLNLLVAEMTNQDPMEPTSNTEFVTQMAQFTSLTYAQQSAEYALSNYASSLVGKTVTASKMDGSEYVTKTGVVESVTKNGDEYTISIGGTSFSISNVTSIAETKTEETETDDDTQLSGNSLGEYIAKASTMIGLSATVMTKSSGVSVVDSGLVTSIQVKDGQVNVIINDIAYPLESIVEVAYPSYIIDDSTDSSESTGSSDNVDDVDEVEGTESTGSTADSATDEEEVEDSTELSADTVTGKISSADDVEEVTEQVSADEYISNDIADLEDFI